jgi:hypothetical protein
LPELVRLAHQLVTGPFKRCREFLERYRGHRPADATLDRFDGTSVRPAVPDEDDGGLHFSFGHVAGERRGGTKVSNRLVAVREAALDAAPLGVIRLVRSAMTTSAGSRSTSTNTRRRYVFPAKAMQDCTTPDRAALHQLSLIQ